MKNDVHELQFYFCPFGYLDMQAAYQIWVQVGINDRAIFDIIDDFRESVWEETFNNIDPVWCVLEHVLEQARTVISDTVDYDFINDFSGRGEIYTHWNYLCSSFDYSDDAREELSHKVAPCLNKLLKDKFCGYFLRELEIGED